MATTGGTGGGGSGLFLWESGISTVGVWGSVGFNGGKEKKMGGGKKEISGRRREREKAVNLCGNVIQIKLCVRTSQTITHYTQ